jgi:hypothetical protein
VTTISSSAGCGGAPVSAAQNGAQANHAPAVKAARDTVPRNLPAENEYD